MKRAHVHLTIEVDVGIADSYPWPAEEDFIGVLNGIVNEFDYAVQSMSPGITIENTDLVDFDVVSTVEE